MHTGSIYHCAWSPDSTQLVTAGADKCLKIWDMTSFTCTQTIALGGDVGDMQNSVCWTSTNIIVSLSLSGALNFFRAGETEPFRVVVGHQAPINALAFDESTSRLVTVCSAGRVLHWTPSGPGADQLTAAPFLGEHHGGKATAVVVSGGQVATIGWDDRLRIADGATGDLIAVVPVGAQPRSVAVGVSRPHIRVVATSSVVKVFANERLAFEEPAAYAPTVVAVAPGSDLVAVGGEDRKVHFYRLAVDGSLAAAFETREAAGAISALAFSPDGALLAGGDATRDVRLYNTSDGACLNSGKWVSHTTRVTSIAWSPSGDRLVSVGTDRRVCIWSPTSDDPVHKIELAHEKPLSGVAWQREGVFWTLSTDGVIKKWTR